MYMKVSELIGTSTASSLNNLSLLNTQLEDIILNRMAGFLVSGTMELRVSIGG